MPQRYARHKARGESRMGSEKIMYRKGILYLNEKTFAVPQSGPSPKLHRHQAQLWRPFLLLQQFLQLSGDSSSSKGSHCHRHALEDFRFLPLNQMKTMQGVALLITSFFAATYTKWVASRSEHFIRSPVPHGNDGSFIRYLLS